MSGILAGKAPSTDAQWARDVSQRLDQLEQSQVTRVGSWTLSDQGGQLVATQMGTAGLSLSGLAETAGAVGVPVTTILSGATGAVPVASVSGLQGILENVANMFGLSGLSSLIGTIHLPSLTSMPLLSQLFSGSSILGSLIPGLDASKITSGTFPATMITGLEALGTDFISIVKSFIPGYSGTDQTTAQTDLGSIVQSVLGVLGNPTSLLTGTATLPGLSSIPVLGGLFSGGSILTSLIPGLDASKIISGSFPQSIVTGLTTLASNVGTTITNLFGGSTPLSQIIAGAVPGLDTSKITSGTFAQSIVSGLPALASNVATTLTNLFGGGTPLSQIIAAAVPGLDTSKITSGTFAQSMITGLTTLAGNFATTLTNLFGGSTPLSAIIASAVPALDASKVTTGQFPQSMVNLTSIASSLLSGTIAQGLIPSLTSGWGGTIASSLLNGTLLASLIPGIDTSKITSGTFAQSMVTGLSTLASNVSTTITNLFGGSTPLTSIIAGAVPSLPASQITSGVFGTGLIPGLDTSKIITGTFPQSMLNITSIASSILTGVLSVTQIPGLDGSKITSGTIAGSMISGVTAGTQALQDAIANALGQSGTGNTVSIVQTLLGAIPNTNVNGTLGATTIGTTVLNAVDALWQAFTGGTATGNSLGNLQNAAALTTATANNATMAAQNANNTLASQAVTKHGWLAGSDPTADSVFPFSMIQGSTPTYVPVSQGTAVQGNLTTPDGGIKKTVQWWGYGTAGITGMYITVYAYNPTTGVRTNLFTSPNIISSVAAGSVSAPAQNYYNIPGTDFINTAQGDWYCVEMAVTGGGTYNIVGLPNHWMSANVNFYPHSMAESRANTFSNTGVTPSYDGGVGAGGAASAATVSSTGTIPVTDTCLVVFSALADSVTTATQTCTVTPSGGSAINVPQVAALNNIASFGTDKLYLFAYVLMYPPTGAVTVSTTTSGGSGTGGQACATNWSSYAGATNAFAFPASNTASATTNTVPVTTAYNNMFIVAGQTMASTSGSLSAPSLGTARYTKAVGSNTNPALFIQDGPATSGAGGTTTVTATQGSSARLGIGIALIGLAEDPAPSSIGSPNPSPNVPGFALGGVAGSPYYAPVTVTFDTPGTGQTYSIPAQYQVAGATFDIVLCGDGSGATGGGISGFGTPGYGAGGWAGSWNSIRLVYGTNIPLGTTAFTVNVGSGGAGGTGTTGNGAAGSGCSVVVPGYGTISVAGGQLTTTSSGHYWTAGPQGQSPGNITFEGVPYTGGAQQNSLNAPGEQPGGGGSSGTNSSTGGQGAPGTVWITGTPPP